MPRQARLDFEGMFYHVINRGMERRKIFENAEDYEKFIDLLARFAPEAGLRVYGWVLIPNHFHLVVRRGKEPLGTFMGRLQTAYAGYFNRRRRRVGRLFQNRFKSILCDENVYFSELVAYVHLNPLRAKLLTGMKELGEYRWSGHRAHLGLDKIPWQDTESVLSRFGRTKGNARRAYLSYLEEKRGVRRDLSGGGLVRSAGGVQMAMAGGPEEYDSRILGDGDFVREVGVRTKTRIVAPGPTVDLRVLIRAVGDQLGVPMDEIVRSGKTTARGSRCREAICLAGGRHFGIKKIILAEGLGVTPMAITKLCRSGEESSEAGDLSDRIRDSIIVKGVP
ncbi:MAG: transposase [Elusimicrobia bacterium]|nr:transposase [Elusimicrobiota bacterium]